MLTFLKRLWKDQRGALTTVEVIGYTVLIGGAVALVGFGVTTLARGKLGATTNAIEDIKACDDAITSSSGYGVTGTPSTDGNTGIVTGITGN
jgi:Flp pilus assembly pilin Flp